MIQAAQAAETRLSGPRRLVLALVGILGMTLLVTVRNLEPDPRGLGTHQQLGWTPCYFLKSTGTVCPLCGTTTAWAHLARGELRRAVHVHCGGMLLGVVVAIGSPWLLLTAAWGKWLLVRPALRPTLTVASVWLAVVVLDWCRRIYSQL